MSRYDPNGQDLDDFLEQVDSLLAEEPEDDWFDDDADTGVEEYAPAESVSDDTQIFYQNFSNDYGRQILNYQNGYGGRDDVPEPVRPASSIPAYNADFQNMKRERSAQARKTQKQHQPPAPARNIDYSIPGEPDRRYASQSPAPERSRSQSPKPRKRGCGTAPLVLILVVAAIVGILMWAFQPPRAETSIGQRKRDTATILLCGTDKGGTRTDTMMLLYLSGSEKSVGLLSLPRDTYTITSAGKSAKLNSAYGRNGTGAEGMEGLLDYVQDIIGYRPDGYILVDMTLVPQLVDLMGGVDVEVPQTMTLGEMTLEEGMQHLSGDEVLTLLRFRKGYATADLKRVEVQRSVIKACMDQWFNLSRLGELDEALALMKNNSISSLSTRNYLWMGKTILFGMGKGVSNETLPGYADYIGGASYYLLDRDEVAALINDSYNPYRVTIAPEDLNIAG